MKKRQNSVNDKKKLINEDLKRFSVWFLCSLLYYVGKDSFTIIGIKRCLFDAFSFTGIIIIGDMLSAIAVNHFRLSMVFNSGASPLFWLTFLPLYYCILFSYLSFKLALLYIVLSIFYAITSLIYWYFRNI